MSRIASHHTIFRSLLTSDDGGVEYGRRAGMVVPMGELQGVRNPVGLPMLASQVYLVQGHQRTSRTSHLCAPMHTGPQGCLLSGLSGLVQSSPAW